MKIDKKSKLLFALSFTLILLLCTTYAWLTLTYDKTKTNVIRAGNLELELDETSEGIKLEKAVPMSLNKGLTLDSYNFTVRNNGTKAVNYTLYLDNDEDDESVTTENRMADKDVKYILSKGGDYTATIKFVEGNYTATYDLIENKFTSVVNSSGTEVSNLAETVNNTIDNDGIARDDAAIEAFKKELYANGTYEVVKNYTIGNISDLGGNPNRILTTGKLENESVSYELRVWIDQEADTSVMGKIFSTKLRLVAEQANKETKITYSYTNKEIKAASKYDSTNCVTGEEPTCETIDLTTYTGEMTPGTIIKYAVNDTEEKYFYVLHDDGENLTLQQRENTTDNIEWNTEVDETKGPITALTALEAATSNWTNVSDQTYTLGTTVYNDNAYTGCSSAYGNAPECTTNTYALSSRTAKARMLTVQEAAALGCKDQVEGSCPLYLHDYLAGASNYGGTDMNTDSNGKTIQGYWTSSVFTSLNMAYYIHFKGYLNYYNINNNGYGTRAVVVINKSSLNN